MTDTTPLTHRKVLALAWPIVLAQAATAMTGVVDTFVMGRFGDKTDLAAVAVAAAAFGFIYWGFGFLRMSTTGLSSQANGAGKTSEVRAILLRSFLLGGSLGLLLILISIPLKLLTFYFFQADTSVEILAADYFNARIWGAPALLISYGITGWLIGVGRTRELLLLQIIMNGVNVGLDVWFVAGLGWGPMGIGAGTAIAEWVALGVGLFIVRGAFKDAGPLFDRDALSAMFAANRDIMIRTLSLLFSFAWFVNAGARVSTTALAGNEVLLQFITMAAFVLDAFAFVAEKEAGEAFGKADPVRLRRAVRVTSTLALGFGAVTSLIFFVTGDFVIESFIRDQEAAASAKAFLPYCALVPLIGIPAWQLDGIFIGTTQGKALRNAGVIAAVLYVATDMLFADFGNTGVWWAFLSMYVWRAICLGSFYPALLRQIRSEEATA